MGCSWHRAVYGIHWTNQFYFRCHHLSGHVACIQREHGRASVSIPVWLVRRRIADADIDRAYDPHSAHSLHSEPCRHARNTIDNMHYGDRYLLAVLAARRACGDGTIADVVFPMACWNPAQLLRTHATGKTSDRKSTRLNSSHLV